VSSRDLAQAIRDLAQYGRLSEESEENISIILDEPEKDEKSEEDKSKSTTANKPGGKS